MSESARALLHYATNWRYGDAHDSDTARCFWLARCRASHIFNGTTQ